MTLDTISHVRWIIGRVVDCKERVKTEERGLLVKVRTVHNDELVRGGTARPGDYIVGARLDILTDKQGQ